MNNENHKDVYARVFNELGNDKFYNTPFLELAEKYGEQYFPKVFAALAESHVDSEFNIAFDDDNACRSELDDYFVDPATLKNAALWMLTENWNGHYKLTNIDNVTKIRSHLVDMRRDFLNDEQTQMLIDLIHVDPKPYWTQWEEE